jgi:hypothetical protein
MSERIPPTEILYIPGVQEVPYETMLAYLMQAIYTFRNTYNRPHDPNKPFISHYTLHDRSVDIISARPRAVLVQVDFGEGEARVTYTVDEAGEYAVVVENYDDQESNSPTERFGLEPTSENNPTLHTILDYIRRASPNPRR